MSKVLAIVWAMLAGVALAQPPGSAPDTPFKLATFTTGGETRTGLILGSTILDIGKANHSLATTEGLAVVSIPNEMRELIESYDTVKWRLYQIANHYSASDNGDIDFAYDVDDVVFNAPIKYPYNLLAVAANYQDHSLEMARVYGILDPPPVDPDRGSPVFFAKSPRSTITDPNGIFPIPPTHKFFDFENELAIIIAKPATRLTLQNARDYIFGYSIIFDVSAVADPNEPDEEVIGWDFGVNWFEGKSRDNAAPFGPVIVPKEFISNPGDLRIVTKVNGVVKQDSNSSQMIHDETYLLRHATSIMTLYAGDVIATGTPAGVGRARNPPEFLMRGDVVEMWIEGIGTLVTTIR